MISKALAHYLRISQAEVQTLLRLSPKELYHDPRYIHLMRTLDIEYLYETLPYAKTVFETGLPLLVGRLSAEHNLYHFPLNSHMISEWITDFLQFPAEVWRLRDVHDGIGLPLIHEAVIEILGMLEALGDASEGWQHAFAVLVIPLAAYPTIAAV